MSNTDTQPKIECLCFLGYKRGKGGLDDNLKPILSNKCYKEKNTPINHDKEMGTITSSLVKDKKRENLTHSQPHNLHLVCLQKTKFSLAVFHVVIESLTGKSTEK